MVEMEEAGCAEAAPPHCRTSRPASAKREFIRRPHSMQGVSRCLSQSPPKMPQAASLPSARGLLFLWPSSSPQHFPSQGSSVCSFNPLLNWAPPGRIVSTRRPAAPPHCPVSFPIFSMLTVLWPPRGEVPSFPFQSPTVPSKNSDLRLWAFIAFLWSKLLSKQDVFHTRKLTRIQSDWREEEWDDHSFLQFLGEFSTRQGIGLLVQLLWTLN